jgi:NADPH:quinone reductase
MRALTFDEPGGPDTLKVTERPRPTAGPGEVVIRPTVATVNPTDLLFRATGGGELPAPWTPGMELAGTVAEVGEGVELREGERVFAIVDPRRPEGGAQAEYVRVPVSWVAQTPAGVSDADAATLPMNGLTVLQALRRLDLPDGATLGVLGSAGAVGQYAVQLGRAAGLRVFADAKPEDAELVRSFGAQVVARSEDPGAAFRAVVPDGVDGLIDAAVIDAAALPAVRDGGALATLRGWSGPAGRGIRVEPLLVTGDLGRQDDLETLADHLAAGRLTTRVAATYPLERAGEAHARLAAGGVRGRLLLSVSA